MADKFAAQLRAGIKRAAWYLLWPAIAVVVWGQLTDQPPEIGPDTLGVDKLLHFTAYFGLTWLATLAWGRNMRVRWIMLMTLVLGGAMEIVQGLLGRDAEWADMAANTLGVVLGGGVALGMLHVARVVDARRGD